MSISDLNRRKKVYPFVRRPPIREAVTTTVEPTIAEWQSYLPASTTPSIDPNSIVSSASINGDYLEVNLQNPGNYSIPLGGAIWDCGNLLDAYGSVYTDDGSSVPLLAARTDTLIPANSWIGAFVSSGTPAATGVDTFGVIIDGSGAITVYMLVSGGSQQSATSGNTDITQRIGILRTLPYSTTQSRYAGAIGYDATGTPVTSRALSLSFISSLSWSRVWIAAGWRAGTSGATAPETVRVSGRTLSALASKWISDGGL